jgi:hypothetical protein
MQGEGGKSLPLSGFLKGPDEGGKKAQISAAYVIFHIWAG